MKVWRAEMGKGEAVEGWGQYRRTNPGGWYVARLEVKEWLPSASRRNSLAARKEAGWRRVRWRQGAPGLEQSSVLTLSPWSPPGFSFPLDLVLKKIYS